MTGLLLLRDGVMMFSLRKIMSPPLTSFPPHCYCMGAFSQCIQRHKYAIYAIFPISFFSVFSLLHTYLSVFMRYYDLFKLLSTMQLLLSLWLLLFLLLLVFLFVNKNFVTLTRWLLLLLCIHWVLWFDFGAHGKHDGSLLFCFFLSFSLSCFMKMKLQSFFLLYLMSFKCLSVKCLSRLLFRLEI